MKETQKLTESNELRFAAVVAAGLAIVVCANRPIAADKSSEVQMASSLIYQSPPKTPNHNIRNDVLIAPPPRFQLPRP